MVTYSVIEVLTGLRAFYFKSIPCQECKVWFAVQATMRSVAMQHSSVLQDTSADSALVGKIKTLWLIIV